MSFMHPVFSGCAAALVTPFSAAGDPDLPALTQLIDRQRSSGADAVVILGTTGEPCTLSEYERTQIIECAIASAGDMPVIIGTGSNDTRRAVEYARQAKAAGARGQLCVTPYYNKCTQQGLIRHYCTIMDSTDLPLIAYNVPARTGVCISPDTLRTLSKHPNMAGLKEAGGDMSLTADLLSLDGCPPVYCGNDDMILPMISMGACGVISVTANVLPGMTKNLTDAALSGDLMLAGKLHDALLPLSRALFAQVNPIPVKAALAHLGLINERLRLPLTPLEEPHRSRLFAILDALNAEAS